MKPHFFGFQLGKQQIVKALELQSVLYPKCNTIRKYPFQLFRVTFVHLFTSMTGKQVMIFHGHSALPSSSEYEVKLPDAASLRNLPEIQ